MMIKDGKINKPTKPHTLGGWGEIQQQENIYMNNGPKGKSEWPGGQIENGRGPSKILIEN